MNREQKRAFVKKAKKRGATTREAKAYAEVVGSGVGQNLPAQEILEDEQIRLNVEAIRNRKNYNQMNPLYREFVDANVDIIFTAHVEHKDMISLKEQPRWLFWSGDLIKIEEGE